LTDAGDERVEEAPSGLLAGLGAVAARPQPGLDEGPDEPGPHGSLVIAAVALNRTSLVATAVGGIARRQGTRTERGDQVLLRDRDDRLRAVSFEDGKGQTADGEELVRADARVVAPRFVVDVHDVVEATRHRVPEPLEETLLRTVAHLAPTRRPLRTDREG